MIITGKCCVSVCVCVRVAACRHAHLLARKLQRILARYLRPIKFTKFPQTHMIHVMTLLQIGCWCPMMLQSYLVRNNFLLWNDITRSNHTFEAYNARHGPCARGCGRSRSMPRRYVGLHSSVIMRFVIIWMQLKRRMTDNLFTSE